MKNRVHLSQPEFSKELPNKLSDFFTNPDLSGSSSAIKEFEYQISKLVRNRQVVGLSSGTAALHLALKLVGVEKGDYVACQSFTFCATANPISYVGATPIFIDSELETWNMCPDLLREYLASAKKENKLPKAIIYVHTYGMPAKAIEIIKVAEEFEVPVIEDAAEAIGSKISEEPVGQFGNIGVISFNGNKIATTSGGGAFITKSESIAKKAVYLATQAKDGNEFDHSEIGYNYRIGALNAIVGIAQLNDIDIWVQQRRSRFNTYHGSFKHLQNLEWQPELEGNYSNRWLSALLLPYDRQPTDLVQLFESNNIEAKRLWRPLHLQKSFKGTKFIGSGKCESLWKFGIGLPSGQVSNESDVERVIEVMENHVG
jgi:dTDP-4-amino-4,6-dideoxygalactose transaminase